MKNRITQKDIESLIYRLNELNGTKGRWNESGAYILAQAYGGARLEQVCNTGGGVRVVSCDGYGTKRQLHAFLMGMIARQQGDN